ncbi:coenzyme F420-0:L-glutamate ligase [Paraburkholderia antibiotica]|uniref:Coenzyme F420-0:L-glutamate ligase n=1 Tax=Paraburkholderia antibiotica TaxID=2728839 RepID=A0A7X9X6R0_9BURK|nr:coenzyme F420-0:L-glutamate ligase [Paraburkholderia antibiotica]NML32358.1 coenzyme F420-0:L-glutamate ligase [Paraburkholderia antibiotica]
MTAQSRAMELVALPGIPEVREGDDVGALLVAAMERAGYRWRAGDIVVIAQKIVSKAEGRTRRLADIEPGDTARQYAEVSGKDPRKVQAMLDESVGVVRVARVPPDGLVITRHRHGWVCANAAIDESNVGEDGTVLLLPLDPDASAARVARTIAARSGIAPGVIVSDTFGRAWRRGLVNVAIGVANVPALVNWIGRADAYGRPLQVSQPALADEVAAAAGLLMGKDSFTPAVLVRGLGWDIDHGANARQLVRPLKEDLFQ